MHVSFVTMNILLMPAKLRISAISYLNTVPLMWDFDHGIAPPQFEISQTVPSACAAALRRGDADIGIIPAFAYASIPGLLILPEVGISAKGAVRSILLVSKVPREEITSVALDSSSRSSAALTRVLFNRWRPEPPTFTSMEPDLDRMLAQSDAALLIGDAALRALSRQRHPERARADVGGERESRDLHSPESRDLHFYDLAEEWHRLTGKPFVFAFWAVRMAALDTAPRELDLPSIFRQSRDHGLEPQNVAAIARLWAPRVGLTESEVIAYLTRNIYYSLDRECLDGMEMFFRYAAEIGLIEETPTLRFMASLSVFQ